jgi:hypothetical protein
MLILVALDCVRRYYIDIGACVKVASGEIKVKNGKIAAFQGDTATFKDRPTANPNTTISATGYTGFPDTARSKCLRVWSLDEGEFNYVSPV